MTQERYRRVAACRVCLGETLHTVLDLGRQTLTGVFPRTRDAEVTTGPLELVWCRDCGLLQLAHSYDPSEIYGDNYGYRSGLNRSMVLHLEQKAHLLEAQARLRPGDIVVDIGSNDGTLLNSFTVPDLRRIGIDPTGSKFQQYYAPGVELLPEFFSADAYHSVETRRARLIMSIAMFYDLDAPIEFAAQVAECLAPDGLWHFEQSYMPSMLRMCSYDTICHEHLEYYSLGVVKRILDEAGLVIVDVRTNAVNGGSFAVTAAHPSPNAVQRSVVVDWMLQREVELGIDTPRPYQEFEQRVYRHRANLSRLLRSLAADGNTVLGYGASTKGNVMLQFCGITEREVSAIAEVNPDKFGCFTPGTRIPIISEEEAHAIKLDFFLVLPWHFRDEILRREREYLANGGRMIFPLPDIEVV